MAYIENTQWLKINGKSISCKKIVDMPFTFELSENIHFNGLSPEIKYFMNNSGAKAGYVEITTSCDDYIINIIEKVLTTRTNIPVVKLETPTYKGGGVLFSKPAYTKGEDVTFKIMKYEVSNVI